MVKPLRLRAEDAEDLGVIGSCLQDALIHVGEMTYQRTRRRFVVSLNRFRWEAPSHGARGHQRVRAGLHFEGVLAVKTQGIALTRRKDLLELLTLHHAPGEDGAGAITLVFAAGAAVRLEVECIDVTLVDLDRPWRTQRKPRHAVDESR